MIFGFREAGGEAVAVLASVQKTGIAPVTRVMLLDASRTNLSADDRCGWKMSGHNLFDIGAVDVPIHFKPQRMSATMLRK